MDKQPNTSGSGRFGGKDLSPEELLGTFPDEKAAEWFERNIWPDGRACPHCGHDHTCVAKHHDMPYYCSPCKRYFSVKTGTVMERSKISYRNWAIATHLVATHPKGISSVQPGRDLGMGQNTASYLPHRLRKAWDTLTGPDQLSGPAWVDEAYFGGREKNKHADKRGKRKKVAVVGIKDREGQGRACPRDHCGPLGWIHRIERGKGRQDIHRRAQITLRAGDHETVNHGDGEYARGGVHVNGMDSVWAPIGRGCNGTYHRIEDEHLHRYINEFTGRLNMRALSAAGKMRKMVQAGLASGSHTSSLWPAVRCAASHSVESGPHPPLHLAWLPPSTMQSLPTAGNKRSCRPNKSRWRHLQARRSPNGWRKTIYAIVF